jgi:stress-induced morphogen
MIMNDTTEALKEAITKALPEAQVNVRNPSGGHFEIAVVSPAFAGKSPVAQQRLVFSAIAHLMKGDAAPVHAIDKMDLRTP